jgi:pimeloyl-ACP methyl ester carboxylesterase
LGYGSVLPRDCQSNSPLEFPNADIPESFVEHLMARQSLAAVSAVIALAAGSAQAQMLVVWGRYDPSFTIDGATAYKQAVPDAEVHILDAGHFALDEKLDDIAALIRGFLSRQPPPFGTSN